MYFRVRPDFLLWALIMLYCFGRCTCCRPIFDQLYTYPNKRPKLPKSTWYITEREREYLYVQKRYRGVGRKQSNHPKKCRWFQIVDNYFHMVVPNSAYKMTESILQPQNYHLARKCRIATLHTYLTNTWQVTLISLSHHSFSFPLGKLFVNVPHNKTRSALHQYPNTSELWDTIVWDCHIATWCCEDPRVKESHMVKKK